MKPNFNHIFYALVLVTAMVFTGCHKEASVDQAMLLGKWTGLRDIEQHGEVSNGSIMLGSGADTMSTNDTLIFSPGGQYVRIAYFADTLPHFLHISSTYAINGNSLILGNMSPSITNNVQVMSLSPNQLVLKTTYMDNFGYDPGDVIVSTLTYIR